MVLYYLFMEHNKIIITALPHRPDSIFGTPSQGDNPSLASMQSPARYFNNKEIEDFFGIDYKEMEKIVSQQKEVIEEFDYSVDQGRPQVHPKLASKLSSYPLATTQLEMP